jgi:hypothetical protein
MGGSCAQVSMTLRAFSGRTADAARGQHAGLLLHRTGHRGGWHGTRRARHTPGRPSVDTDSGALRPYHLHELVREAVRTPTPPARTTGVPPTGGGRTFDALGHEFNTYGGDPDRRCLLSCLRQGLRLAGDFDLELGWLADAAFTHWRSSTGRPSQSTAHYSISA